MQSAVCLPSADPLVLLLKRLICSSIATTATAELARATAQEGRGQGEGWGCGDKGCGVSNQKVITALCMHMCVRESSRFISLQLGGRRLVSEPSRPRRVYRMRGGSRTRMLACRTKAPAHAAGRDRQRILENVIMWVNITAGYVSVGTAGDVRLMRCRCAALWTIMKGTEDWGLGTTQKRSAVIGWREIKRQNENRAVKDQRENEEIPKKRAAGGIVLDSQLACTCSVDAALQLILCQGWWRNRVMQKALNTSATHAHIKLKCSTAPR